MNWIILIVHDGPIRVAVYGDQDGKPFLSQQAAEEHAQVFPRREASYSVYVTQIEKG